MKKTLHFQRAPLQQSRQLSAVMLLLCGASLLTGCANEPPHSLATLPKIEGATLDKVSDHLAKESAQLKATQDDNRKNMEQMSLAPAPLPIEPKHDPLEDIVVSVSLHNASLSDVLQVLGEQAKMNMIVDPKVIALDEHASLYLNHVTARELYRQVLEAFDLSGSVEGNTIKIGLYDQRLFNLNFLNTGMNLKIDAGGNVFGSIASGGGASGSGGGSTGSGGGSSGSGGGGDLIRGSVSVTGGSSKQSEPYSEIEENLKRILGSKEGKEIKRKGGGEFSADMGAQGSSEQDRREMGAVYTLNRSSGTLYVSARPTQMRMVAKLVDRYTKVMRRQVVIEAQILDVTLNDQYQFGVDWNLLKNHVAGVVGTSPITSPGVTANLPGTLGMPASVLTFPAASVGAAASTAAAGLMYNDKTVSAALNMLRTFGNVRVLSNPNIRVRNNTPALLSVGTSDTYVASSSMTSTNPGGGATTLSSSVQTNSVFAGVVVGVVPFIDDEGNIELLVHPMQTDVDATSMTLQNVGNGNMVTLPKVSYKGMTTTLNLHDGDTVIIGGLIDQSSSTNNQGVPGLSDVPVLGQAFNNDGKTSSSRELVIVLRVKKL